MAGRVTGSGRLPAAVSQGAFLVGFALGGFFDGILLHQILQWHHLLSAVDVAPFQTLEGQVLADGLFHAAMYLLAALGLLRLWQARDSLPRAGAALAGWGILGFGAWHVVDGVVSHWLLGIHHIRMDVADPLPWDILFLLFGIVLVAVGWLVLRRGPARRTQAAGGSNPMLSIALVTALAGGWAGLPPGKGAVVNVAFPESVDAGAAMLAVAAAGGTTVSAGRGTAPWLVRFEDRAGVARLRRTGATVTSASAFPFGCFGASGASLP